MLAFPLTQVTSTVQLPSRHLYMCVSARKLINANSHTHTIENNSRQQKHATQTERATISVCEGDRPVCEAVLEKVLRFGTS